MPWSKGQSGNPGGRPKGVAEVEQLARTHAPEAIAALVKIVKSEKSPPQARVSAASVLLDRGYGKPRQDMRVQHVEQDHLIAAHLTLAR